MDNNLDSARTNAYNAAQNVSELQASSPQLLNDLRQNLVGIFAKDNPIIGARNDALSNYLSTAARSRADTLFHSGDVPGIEGRPLTFSPTMQDAITTSRNSAALAPLAGYNEILKGMYGTIGDVVKNAGDIYTGQISAAQTNASNLMDLYKQALEEYKAKQSANSGGLDLASILALIRGNLGVGSNDDGGLDTIFSAPAPTATKSVADQVAGLKGLDFSKVTNLFTSPTSAGSASLRSAPPQPAAKSSYPTLNLNSKPVNNNPYGLKLSL